MTMARGRFFLRHHSHPYTLYFALLFLVFEGSTPHSLHRFDTDNPGALSLTVDNVQYHPFQGDRGVTESSLYLYLYRKVRLLHSHL
jgi:hypothetical protein